MALNASRIGLAKIGTWNMQQQIAVITLGIDELDRSLKFYDEGFGWQPSFEAEGIAFYQMNGLVLGLWLKSALADDVGRDSLPEPGACSLAHNVRGKADVIPLMGRLCAAGGTMLREADKPPYGGLRGYVADPDGQVWEIAWNPTWQIDEQGHVSMPG
jgi:catechol 2,3-dioxygenase-like lactoylglutathione lyase family enzyme